MTLEIGDVLVLDHESYDRHEGHFSKKFNRIVAKILGSWEMVFKSMEVAENMWAPFHGEEEWELARFLMKNIGQTKMDEFLKLDIVQQNGVSFDNTQSLLKYVHGQIAYWTSMDVWMMDVEGDIVTEDGMLKCEQLELWQHNPVEYMWELMGNPAFWDMMSYVPEHAYADAKGKNCIYNEMWTGKWWWNKKILEGGGVAPVILSSDKMNLSQFSGDKKAWLVYLSIRNISKGVQQQVSAHVTLLIGYLPVSKLKCFHKKSQSLAGYHLFHHVMSLLLHPLCLVACNKESQCLHCLVQSNWHGGLEEYLRCMRKNKQLRKFDTKGLCAVFNPFWKELPFTDIFICLTPDILHQLHKGVFHDHLIQWCLSIVSKEIDVHFQAMTQYPSLCHFKKGISSVSQWTGTEHKEMERVFVSLLASAVNDCVLIIACSLLDFIYYAQLQKHMNTTLTAMEQSLKMFHSHKHVLDFNVPKIHSLKHYVSLIQALSKYPKCLHIDYAKDGYQASNK
ncbi:hypothetical protein EV401DRAFT_2054275 [Pisolithus croceorrhizus]|nr:hypothetical protein EV401DRAFT_2054275 [Pisolithus croceorrhizus]